VDVLQRDERAGVPRSRFWSCSTAWRWKKVPRPHVLAGEADAEALLEQAGIRQVLGHAPVERQLALAHLARSSMTFCDAGMQLEIAPAPR
jgi:hypothetical protein